VYHELLIDCSHILTKNTAGTSVTGIDLPILFASIENIDTFESVVCIDILYQYRPSLSNDTTSVIDTDTAVCGITGIEYRSTPVSPITTSTTSTVHIGQ
jgi:hypothetical protein